jgi:hypothetical protein
MKNVSVDLNPDGWRREVPLNFEQVKPKIARSKNILFLIHLFLIQRSGIDSF